MISSALSLITLGLQRVKGGEKKSKQRRVKGIKAETRE
jgi:hypothetical protein